MPLDLNVLNVMLSGRDPRPNEAGALQNKGFSIPSGSKAEILMGQASDTGY